MDIISRNQWGARAPRSRVTTTWSKRTGFTVHYSAGPPTQTVKAIQNYHMDNRGWSDTGYNFLVDTAGRIYEGRGWLVIGAHVANHNTAYIGVCFIGRDPDVTDAAQRSIRALYDQACRRAGRTLTRRGHGQLAPTACPGPRLQAWVNAGMPDPGGTPPSKPPAPTAPPWPGRVLVYTPGRPMMRGADVRTWQARMAARGWRITVDGIYGPQSGDVATRFQREKRLLVDGKVGPQTWAAAWTAPIT